MQGGVSKRNRPSRMASPAFRAAAVAALVALIGAGAAAAAPVTFRCSLVLK